MKGKARCWVTEVVVTGALPKASTKLEALQCSSSKKYKTKKRS